MVRISLCSPKKALSWSPLLLVICLFTTACTSLPIQQADEKKTQTNPTTTIIMPSNTKESPISTQTPIDENSFEVGCIRTFEEFAFAPFPEDITQRISTSIPPQSPWTIVTELPLASDPWIITSSTLKTLRNNDGLLEIWLSVNLTSSKSFQNGEQDEETNRWETWVYVPELDSWSLLPDVIDSYGVSESTLFSLSDGSILAVNSICFNCKEASIPISIPVFSKYNNGTKLFEQIQDVFDLPIKDAIDQIYFEPDVFLDTHDIFWVFIPADGFYSFDPSKNVVERFLNLPDYYQIDVTFDNDGSIYIQYDTNSLEDELFSSEVLQFFPEENKYRKIEIPETISRFGVTGLNVDRDGRLWFGSIGFLDRNYKWHFLPSNPENYFSQSFTDLTNPPELLLESSNGILWYSRNTLGSYASDGIAWYDPIKQTGCQITNIGGNVFEDLNQTIWVLAENTLYSYEISP